MADSRPSTAGEKTDNKSKGFFSRMKTTKVTVLNANDDNLHEKGGDSTTEIKPVVKVVPPISFTQLFRLAKFLGASRI